MAVVPSKLEESDLPYIIALAVVALAGGLFRSIAKKVGGLDAGTELNPPEIKADVPPTTTKG